MNGLVASMLLRWVCLAAVQGAAPTLQLHSTLVLVPTTVRTKGGEPAYNLKAEDATVTYDGAPAQASPGGGIRLTATGVCRG